jgi:hypothetical protein
MKYVPFYLLGLQIIFISISFECCSGSTNSTNLPIQMEAGQADVTKLQKFKEAEDEKEVIRVEEKNEEVEKREVLVLDIFPAEIWQEIFLCLSFKELLLVRAVSSNFSELITGSRQVGRIGVANKPRYNISSRRWAIKKTIDFKSEKLSILTPETISSFAFYHLIGIAKNLPLEFWPYLEGSNIYMLDLSNNTIGSEGATDLAQHLQKTNINIIDLYGNKIDAKGARTLAQHLQKTHIHTLHLNWNQIGAEGAVALAKYLPQTHIHTLSLSYNNIGPKGAIKLAEYLPQTMVHVIDLSYNNIGGKGAIELIKHLAQTKVHTLDLNRNRIGAEDSIELAKHLSKTQIHTINLNWNRIGDEGAIELANLLPQTQVRTIFLCFNNISEQTKNVLRQQYPYINWYC